MGFVLLVITYHPPHKEQKVYTYGNSMSSFSSQSVIGSDYYIAFVDAIVENMQCV
jgi:hypothetical protein